MNALPSFLTEFDLHLLRESTHYRSWEKLGAHLAELDGDRGVRFAVWAPNASRVTVVGDFNGWNEDANPMACRGESGIWEGFVPGIGQGAIYKYAISSNVNGYKVQKTDPFAFFGEQRPRSGSVVWDLSGYGWNDGGWMTSRGARNRHDAPMSIYEVHLGSWMRVPEEGHRWLTYRELAPKLARYARDMGFTHVELLPVAEHPLDGSWGYQTIGHYAPTSRFGTPQDFMFLVDTLHQHDVGVIVDWVPSHFPRDGHGLGFFDGTCLFEHSDPREGEHKEWGTYVFNYGRREVANFLLSNALFWLEVYHIDGLRVDAVASMLYRDYSRNEGEWIPNKYGGRENLEAVDFLKRFNEVVYKYHPDAFTVAEESTAWTMVSRPTYLGGLGFGYKWNMGWMHDMLVYATREPIHRKYHHNNITFSLLYAFHENFVLPFSHDEVVHGKGSMLGKMPGDLWQKFANLRALYGYMFAHPGKKLLFMGSEFGQWSEWNFEQSLEWHLLQHPSHQGLQRWVRDLNHVLRREPALHAQDFDGAGFRWIDCNDSDASVVSFLRFGRNPDEIVACVCNFTPVPRYGYRIGVPRWGWWEEILNSDAGFYGGGNLGNGGGVHTEGIPSHGHPQSLNVLAPPLGCVMFRVR